MFIKVVDLMGMDPDRRVREIQEPVYQFWRRLFAGPLYESRDFCYKKFVPGPDTGQLSVTLMLVSPEPHAALLGAIVTKFEESDQLLQGKLATFCELTVGHDTSVGARFWPQVMFADLLRYNAAKPDRIMIGIDVATSPLTFAAAASGLVKGTAFQGFYPRPDAEMPADLARLVIWHADRSSYKRVPGHPDPFVRQGAQPRETLPVSYSRITRGVFDDEATRYYFHRTSAVHGWGILMAGIVSTEMLDSKIQQDGVDTDMTLRDAVSALASDVQDGNEMPLPRSGKAGKQVALQTYQGTDFEHLLSLRSQPPVLLPQLREFVVPPTGMVWSADRQAVVHNDRSVLTRLCSACVNSPYMRAATLGALIRMLHRDVNVHERTVLTVGDNAPECGLGAVLMGATHVHFQVDSAATAAAVRASPLINNIVHHVHVGTDMPSLPQVDIACYACSDAVPSTEMLRHLAARVKLYGTLIMTVPLQRLVSSEISSVLRPFCGLWDLASLTCQIDPLPEQGCLYRYCVLLRLSNYPTAHLTSDFDAKVSLQLSYIADLLIRRSMTTAALFDDRIVQESSALLAQVPKYQRSCL